ncbi:MAG: ATP-binding protein [Bacilli bacterium]
MNTNLTDFTFLTEKQLFGNKKLDILKKYGMIMPITDFAILLGALVGYNCYSSDGKDLKNRSGYYFSSSIAGCSSVRSVDKEGGKSWNNYFYHNYAARPASLFSDIKLISPNVERGANGLLEIEYGEYPQYVVSESQNRTLEESYRINGMKKTGKTYTTDSNKRNDYESSFNAMKHEEYEVNGKKYVRIISKPDIHGNVLVHLSNGVQLYTVDDQPIWVEVQPIKWLVDEKAKIILSKRGLFSGVTYSSEKYNGDFKKTEIKKFMDNYFSKDIKTTRTMEEVIKDGIELQEQVSSKKKNPYNFNFENATEEDIIRGAVESGVAVFLHGQSSEGKSARVKQLDPDLEIIYLRNATPDSLNGKSVYNPINGGMIDVPPTWFKKLCEKCEKEPDKIHIIFFDEITNALLSIQGMAFNIILDREVNGVWKLPTNARVVAAGNDLNDSLAANQLAEPLFNRFAHVYIQTSVEDWLKWAMTADNERIKLDFKDDLPKHKIHPSVYAYIAFKREKALRSTYTGDKPNADPRKWEMASLMLYKTNQPEMLRALVGDDLTRDFVHFCNQEVITLPDVIAGNYNENDLDLDISEQWATTVGLSYVDDINVEKVREFVSKFEPELISVFDSLWTHGDKKRLEKVAELRLKDNDLFEYYFEKLNDDYDDIPFYVNDLGGGMKR